MVIPAAREGGVGTWWATRGAERVQASGKNVTLELGPQGKAFQVESSTSRGQEEGACRASGMSRDTHCACLGAPSKVPPLPEMGAQNGPGPPRAERGLEVTQME